MAGRDDFPIRIKEALAKRVANHCSNPKCGITTIGPREDPEGSVNIGVAAHIAAAAKGGKRYDPRMTPEERKSINNGIWLCQNCAKLIDSDEDFYDVEMLHQWKTLAEKVAAQELRLGRTSDSDAVMFARIEQLMPELLAEMRNDLAEHPTIRECVLLRARMVFNYPHPHLVYLYDNHPNLNDQMTIMENYQLVRSNPGSNVRRYIISEKLARYLEQR